MRRLVTIAVTLIAVVFMVRTFVPYWADHNETALPIPGGLPYRLHHAGRDYLNSIMCAGEGWCSGQPRCRVRADLETSGPLLPVGEVPTFLGAPHPLFSRPDSIVPHPAPDTPTYGLAVLYHEECYVTYALSGGL